MRLFALIALFSCAAFALRAEETAPQPEVDARAATPKLKSPSNLKFNSTSGEAKAFAPAPAGQALTADSTGFKSVWAYVKGTNIDSNPASSGMVLTADGNGKAAWAVIPAASMGGLITNAQLTNSSLTVTAGTGLSGGGVVALGGSTTLSLGSNLTLGGTTTGTFAGNGSGLTNLNIAGGLADGAVTNAKLANASLTVTAGTGLSGGGVVALGGSTTLSLGSNLTLGGTTTGTFAGPLTGNVTGNVTGEVTGNVKGGLDILFPNSITQNGTRFISTDASPNFNFFAGLNAGSSAVNGKFNVACGGQALGTSLLLGNNNVAVGYSALDSISSGSNNVGLGFNALNAIETTSNNIAIGSSAGINITGSDNIVIGNSGTFGESGTIRIGTSGTHTTTFLAGKVGIGTTTVTRGALEVGGSTNNLFSAGYGLLTPTGVTANNPFGILVDTSIYATENITARSFLAFSDERIKKVAGVSDGAADLNTLMDIRITDYTYKDTVAKGSRPQKKVIAQQVERIFPQAVLQMTDAVPDIYKKAAFKDGWVTLASDLKTGERVRIIADKADGIHDVLEVKDGAFRTAFKTEGKEVFVFGREVKDFRAVDYEAIAMLNVSATQQIKKEKDAEIARLNAKIAELEAKDKAREARLARLEKLLPEVGQPRTVRALAEKE